MIGWRKRREEELNREIEEHIALETQDNIERGMSPEDSRYAALRSFGNVMRVKEDVRNVWVWSLLELLFADIKHALRRIQRRPRTSMLAVLSLSIAIGPSVALFSVMDVLLLTRPPVRAPEALVSIQARDTGPTVGSPYVPIAYSEYQDFQRSLKSFSGLIYEDGVEPTAVVNGRRVFLNARVVSTNFFELLGVPLHLGPGFSEQRQGVVISHGFWAREFGRRTDAIGQNLIIGGQAFPIVGVADPAFQGLSSINILPPDMWIPIELWSQLEPGSRALIESRSGGKVKARLRSGVSVVQAGTEVEAAFRQMQLSAEAGRHLITETSPAFAQREKTTIFFTSLGVVIFGILLAVACANVAGILLAQAEERRGETAVRQALGAPRVRLIREWMVESTLLAALGTALGLGGARVLMAVLPRMLPESPFTMHNDLSIGPRVWLFAVALMCFSVVSFGLVPAWRSSRPDVVSGLRRDSMVSLLHVRVPVRSLLIIAQVAAAEILLFGAGLVLAQLAKARDQYAGLDPQRPIVVAILESGVGEQVDIDALTARLAQVGGVHRVTYGQCLPLLGGSGPKIRMELPGQEPREVVSGYTGPNYLSALGMRILAGRDLQSNDQHSVVVNETLAREVDPTGNPIGREIRLDGTIKQVVGVLQNAPWENIHNEVHPLAISIITAQRSRGVTLAIEVKGDPNVYLPTLRKELTAAQPGAVILLLKTLRQHYQDALFLERAATGLLYGIGFLAVLLAGTGLHGIASALFARRSREYAIRLALGATPRQLLRLVFAGSLKLAFWGIGLGLIIAFLFAFITASRVHGFRPWSLPAVGLSCAIVLLAAVAAAIEPVRRVLSLQPAEILRSE